MVLNLKTKFIVTGLSITYCMILLLTEHLNGGVTAHYILQDESLPKISNWWGLLCVPLVTWLVLVNKNEPISKEDWQLFLGGILFGSLLTILFYNAPELTSYLMLFSFGAALFIPLYKAEFYLGYVLSLVYGFGGVIPTVFGLIIIAIYAIEYRLIRRLFLVLVNKILIR